MHPDINKLKQPTTSHKPVLPFAVFKEAIRLSIQHKQTTTNSVTVDDHTWTFTCNGKTWMVTCLFADPAVNPSRPGTGWFPTCAFMTRSTDLMTDTFLMATGDCNKKY